jgi:hypothetical protein
LEANWVPELLWTVGVEVSLLTLPTVARMSSSYSCYYMDYIVAATKFNDGIKDFVCLDNNEHMQLDGRSMCGECAICVCFFDKVM